MNEVRESLFYTVVFDSQTYVIFVIFLDKFFELADISDCIIDHIEKCVINIISHAKGFCVMSLDSLFVVIHFTCWSRSVGVRMRCGLNYIVLSNLGVINESTTSYFILKLMVGVIYSSKSIGFDERYSLNGSRNVSNSIDLLNFHQIFRSSINQSANN